MLPTDRGDAEHWLAHSGIHSDFDLVDRLREHLFTGLPDNAICRGLTVTLVPKIEYVSAMNSNLSEEERSAVTLLLGTGKTIKEIANFADIARSEITEVARSLNIEPPTAVQQRAKLLFGDTVGLTYQEVAKTLTGEGFSGDDDATMHHLTVASWVRNHGWPWGGAQDGNYAPERASSAPPRSKYVLRLSKAHDSEVNSASAIEAAATTAWDELSSDRTLIVQVAVIRGAASAGVTDLAAVKKTLMAARGETIRTARV